MGERPERNPERSYAAHAALGKMVREGGRGLAVWRLRSPCQSSERRITISSVGLSTGLFARPARDAHRRKRRGGTDVALPQLSPASCPRTVVHGASSWCSRNHRLDFDHPRTTSFCRLPKNGRKQNSLKSSGTEAA